MKRKNIRLGDPCGATYLSDRTSLVHHLIDSNAGERNNGTQGKQPANSNCPAGVDVVTVRHRGVDNNAE